MSAFALLLVAAKDRAAWWVATGGALLGDAAAEPTHPFHRLPPPTRAAVFVALLGLVLLGLLLVALVMIGARWVRRGARSRHEARDLNDSKRSRPEQDRGPQPASETAGPASRKTLHGDPSDDTLTD